MSEYDPLFPFRSGPSVDDRPLEIVRKQFRQASAPYLSGPWTWWTWALLLPAAALFSERIAAGQDGGRWSAILFLWSAAILLGGAVEAWSIRRAGLGLKPSPLASWALRCQGNLSLVALVLSALLIWRGHSDLVPGLWLLLLGHSFYTLGGLSEPALKRYGLLYQIGGALALYPGARPLAAFAAAAFVANFFLGYAVWKHNRERRLAEDGREE